MVRFGDRDRGESRRSELSELQLTDRARHTHAFRLLTVLPLLLALLSCCSLKRGLSDDLVKKAFVGQLTTGVITFTVVDQAFEAPKGSLFTWNKSNGLRFVDGKLDLYTKKDRFWYVDYVRQIKLTELLANLPGPLPLSILLQIRDDAARRTAVVERIAKALGLDQVTWDIEADAAEVRSLEQCDIAHAHTARHVQALT